MKKLSIEKHLNSQLDLIEESVSQFEISLEALKNIINKSNLVRSEFIKIDEVVCRVSAAKDNISFVEKRYLEKNQ